MSENKRVLCDVAHSERLIHRNMYSMKTIEYLMLKQKKMTDIAYYHFWGLCVLFFTNEKCNEMMWWISLIKWNHVKRALILFIQTLALYKSFTYLLTYLLNKLLSDINISQGSVATRLRCGGIFNERLHCKFSGDYNSERIFKIGQYLTKLCVEHLGFTFWPILYGAI